MINKVDIVKEHKFSWMCWHISTDNTKSKIAYILKAVKDKSNKSYGIILCNTFINITEFKNTFKSNKYNFIKLCYITIKGFIKLHIEKFIFNIKKHFKYNIDTNIIFE